MGTPIYTSEQERESAFLVGIQFRNQPLYDVEDSLDELAALADTAGSTVAGRVIFKESEYHAATLIGKGKTELLAARVGECGATTIVFDDDLTPAQGRNLSQITQAKIVDRTQLILHIFGQHAQTRAGRLQIEFAQLQYLLPRLRRRWTHLERQQGGIGLRGPGEKQLELDRRRIEDRLHCIRQELTHVIRHRMEQRRGRRRHGWALIALVGYTNAGKSTLMNALTGADAKVDNQLFATLDPLTRKMKLPNRQPALLSDTVGFIRKLPHHLVEAFKATLEEVTQADLLLHVIDASHPRAAQQIESVREVLRELQAEDKPTVHVLNKMDCPEARGQSLRLREQVGRCVEVSALKSEGLPQLLDEIADSLRLRNVEVRLRLRVDDGRRLALIRGAGCVYGQDLMDDEHLLVRARIPVKLREQLRAFVVEDDGPEQRRHS